MDPMKAVIADAQLTLRGLDGVVAQIQSEKFGEFRFSHLLPGTYSIEATSPGFLTKTVTRIRVSRGAETTVTIRMTVAPVPPCHGPEFSFDRIKSTSSEIAGAVESEFHGPLDVMAFAWEPAENVLITATGRKGKQPVASARTNKEGHFELAIRNPGRYTVTAHQDGHADAIVEDVEARKGRRTTIKGALPLGACGTLDRCEPTRSSDPVSACDDRWARRAAVGADPTAPYGRGSDAFEIRSEPRPKGATMGPRPSVGDENQVPWRGPSGLQSRESSRLFFPPRRRDFQRAAVTAHTTFGSRSRRVIHSSLLNTRGPTAIIRGNRLNSADGVQGSARRVR